jgi:tripartite-type tricarboxylate transporter receptor subunit TctC
MERILDQLVAREPFACSPDPLTPAAPCDIVLTLNFGYRPSGCRMKMTVLAFALVWSGSVHAQGAYGPAVNYPNRPVKVIVPFAPGGVTDVIARMWAQRMTQSSGQNFYVENLGGGGSNIGMGIAARQAPDGYAILLAATSFTVNPSLYNKIAYDPFKDFAPVTLVASTPNVLVVHPSVPAKSLSALIELLRAHPGKYSYATSGAGTPNHIQAEVFKLSLKLDLTGVPFSGGGPAIQSTVAGHTPIAFTSLTPVQSLVAGGQLRALAVTGIKRSPVWPDVPTLAEAGVPGQEADTFTGLLVPAGTPRGIIDKLHAETVKILAKPEMAQQLEQLGFIAGGNSPDEFAARLKEEIASWRKMIEDAHIEKQ